MEDIVFVPVRWGHLPQVRAMIKRLEAKAVAGVEDGENGVDRAELLRRVYESCSKPTQRVLRYLAERGGQWVLGVELAEEAAQQGNNNVSPQMRSLNAACTHHGLDPKPIRFDRRHDRLFLMKMPEEDATIVREFAS